MDKSDLARRIGLKIRELREGAGLTQRKLASVSGLSPSMLSRIENGLTIPSITTLQVIADTLKTDIGYFFQAGGEKGFLITVPGNRRKIISRSGTNQNVAYELELLASGMQNPFMEPAIVTYVGRDEEVEFRVHDGQEFMYVLEGTVKLTLGSQEFILKPGCAAYWNGNVPHKGVSVGNRPARALHVHLIPGRWTGTFQYEDITWRKEEKR